MATIQYVGFSDMEEVEREQAEQMTQDYAEKIAKKLDTEEIIVHMKEYHKAGNRTKFSLHVRIRGKKDLEATAVEWELPKVMHMAFHDILAQIDHIH